MEYEPERRLIGYARVSTDDQDLTLQREALIRYGVKPEHIYEEHASGKSMERKQLRLALKSMRAEDTIIVWKLDRLGRTLKGVLEVLEHIEANGVKFVSLTESFDTTTPIGKAMLHICMVFAELERSMIAERTKAGMMEAKKRGQRYGKPHTIRDVPRRLAYLRRLHKAGKLLDKDGDPIPTAESLRLKLNDLDPEAPEIESAETIRRWYRGNATNPPLVGLDVTGSEDEPLDVKEQS